MIGNFIQWLVYIFHSIGIEISAGIVSIVQLWAKEAGILSGTNNGMIIHIFNAVSSD